MAEARWSRGDGRSGADDDVRLKGGMIDDFENTLKAKLERNVEVARARQEAERELARREADRRAEEERRRQEQAAARDARHEKLVDHLQVLVGRLEEQATESVDARIGWTASGEEFVAKLTTVQLRPKRSLLIELDRDDDEVLARWHSDVGNAVEMWRLSGFTPEMLTRLVLQLVDEELWHGRTTTPPFPGVEY